MDIQWYPGHMTRARRQMQEDLKLVDLIIELIDARVPLSGRNPDIQNMGQGKGRIIVLNKADLADEKLTGKWTDYYREQGAQVLAADSREKSALKRIRPLVMAACKEKMARDAARGIKKRTVRAMVCGIPNVGKSTFINSLAGKATAKTGNKPGVTRGKQWIHLAGGIDLMDTPGILWPKFEDPEAGEKLAMIGSISDDVVQNEELALKLIDFLRKEYPGALETRYKTEESPEKTPAQILGEIAEKRGMIAKGGELSYDRAANVLLDEFRNGKLGRVTLDRI
ncbi:MAG: ribosome biogenesis GTPase YlqF [Eubacteriales bacterium]|jgi:ribosome biogenesis GTPase A